MRCFFKFAWPCRYNVLPLVRSECGEGAHSKEQDFIRSARLVFSPYNRSLILIQIIPKERTLNDWPRGKQWVLFPLDLNVQCSTLRVPGKQNSLFEFCPWGHPSMVDRIQIGVICLCSRWRLFYDTVEPQYVFPRKLNLYASPLVPHDIISLPLPY